MEIELVNISHCFDKRLMIEDVNVTVPSGQTLVVSGDAGCGKSLLFSIISGVLAPDSGEVLFDGQSIVAMDRQQNLAFRRQLGVVFQVNALVSNLSLRENLMLPLNLYFPDKDVMAKQQQVETICKEFGLGAFVDARTDELSSGMAALAALARALMLEPQCLIWDAPLNEIDLKWGEYVFRRLKHMKRAGMTMVLFTNKKILIEQFADLHLALCPSPHSRSDFLVCSFGQLKAIKREGADAS